MKIFRIILRIRSNHRQRRLLKVKTAWCMKRDLLLCLWLLIGAASKKVVTLPSELWHANHCRGRSTCNNLRVLISSKSQLQTTSGIRTMDPWPCDMSPCHMSHCWFPRRWLKIYHLKKPYYDIWHLISHLTKSAQIKTDGAQDLGFPFLGISRRPFIFSKAFIGQKWKKIIKKKIRCSISSARPFVIM